MSKRPVRRSKNVVVRQEQCFVGSPDIVRRVEKPMVDMSPLFDPSAVRRYVEKICFKTGPPRTVGVELEWIVVDLARPHDPVPIARVRDALEAAGPLPAGSSVTFEPGGQVELSSQPAPGLSACWRAMEADVEHLGQALGAAGVTLLSTAIDPFRSPRRQVTHPRYVAMEAYFDRRGPHGRIMMCSTAAVQVNVDTGRDAADAVRRWRVLNAVGPAMVAAFANSAVHAGQATGWKSTRQAVWQQLDRQRTGAPAGQDPVTAWARYALEAPVMVLRAEDAGWTSDPGFTFGAWLNDAGRTGMRPTQDDLVYHLSTLFPPVRPRTGWLEVRYVDAQPAGYWPVPLAVLTALVDVPWAGEIVVEATRAVAGRWLDAARYGMGDEEIAHAAMACFETAVAALRTLDVDAALVELVESYLGRYVARRRCPADDALTAATLEQKELT